MKELTKEERFLIDMFCIENYSDKSTISLQGCAKALKAYADQEKKKEAIAFGKWKDENFFTNENILPYMRPYQVSKYYIEGNAKLFDYKEIYKLFNQQK